MNTPPLFLTPGEHLEIFRRRFSFRIRDLVSHYEVPLRAVQRWLRDQEDPLHAPPTVTVDELTAGEWSFLQRRRAGLTLREVAAAVGLSLAYVHRAEMGHACADALVEYWKAQLDGADVPADGGSAEAAKVLAADMLG